LIWGGELKNKSRQIIWSDVSKDSKRSRKKIDTSANKRRGGSGGKNRRGSGETGLRAKAKERKKIRAKSL